MADKALDRIMLMMDDDRHLSTVVAETVAANKNIHSAQIRDNSSLARMESDGLGNVSNRVTKTIILKQNEGDNFDWSVFVIGMKKRKQKMSLCDNFFNQLIEQRVMNSVMLESVAEAVKPPAAKKKKKCLDETKDGETGDVKKLDRVEGVGTDACSERWSNNGIVRMRSAFKKALPTPGAAETDWIDVFRVVINPKSFNASCENMFHLSHMAKDTTVILRVDGEDGLVMCQYRAKPVDRKKNDEEDHEKEYLHWCCNLTRQKWKTEIARLNLEGKEPFVGFSEVNYKDITTSMDYLALAN